MIVSQIIRIRLLQSPIPFSSLPQSILPLRQEKQSRTRRSANPQHPETDSIPRFIRRRLAPQKNITRHDATYISEPYLGCRAHAALIVPRHEVAHPDQHDGLRDISAWHDEEQGEVLHASGEIVLREKHDVSD